MMDLVLLEAVQNPVERRVPRPQVDDGSARRSEAREGIPAAPPGR